MGIVGAESGRAQVTLDGATKAFAQRGLLVREQAVTSNVSEALGAAIDGQLMQARASVKRRPRARRAIVGLLQRGRCSGSALEVLLGHLAPLAMARRP
eukprot:206813-Pyramimonas_sp.AAC.1